MTSESFEKLIVEGIKDLPQEALVEIADFIYFIRKRFTQPQNYEEELQSLLFSLEIKRLDYKEAIHLEKEFDNYDKLYPKE